MTGEQIPGPQNNLPPDEPIPAAEPMPPPAPPEQWNKDQRDVVTRLHQMDDFGRIVASAAQGRLPEGWDVDDIMQMVLMRAAKVPDLFNPELPHAWVKTPELPHAWVKTVAGRLMIDLARRRHTVAMPDTTIEEHMPPSRDHAELVEQQHVIQSILSKLSPEHREVLELHYLKGKSVEEIAEEVGIPQGTVKTRLHHGRNDAKRHARRLGIHSL